MANLPDLSEIMSACTKAVKALDVTRPVTIREDVWQEIIKEFGDKWDIHIVDNKTLIAINDKGQRNFISAQELPIAKAVVPYLTALYVYKDALDQYSNDLGLGSRINGVGKALFSRLPAENWIEILSSSDKVEDPLQTLQDRYPDPVDVQRMEALLSTPSLSGGKKFDRSDWMESGMKKIGNWISEASSGRVKLVNALYKISDLEGAVEQDETTGKAEAETAADKDANQHLKGGRNIIYYGAPGTGKSHTLEKMSKGDEVFRTVFHPDVQNADFFGTLKPSIGEAGEVSYGFAPGAFVNALVFAMANPKKKTWLIIEELNRAPAAAVFGELFLLLDRDDDGTSEYDVACPSVEAASWLETHNALIKGKLKIPSNLWIAATMNSADQGVYPLDTAFRRRWEQTYMPLDYSGDNPGVIEFANSGGGKTSLEWMEFTKRLNQHLAASGLVSEDRLIGPWFVKGKELPKNKSVPGKLLIYLWDDLFRTHGRECVFKTEDIHTYGGLVQAMQKGRVIFSDVFLEKLENNA